MLDKKDFPPLAWHGITVAALITLLAIAWWHYGKGPMNHDAAWYYLADQGLLNGKTLYRDLIDFNTPLAYFSLWPAAFLGKTTGLSPLLATNITQFIYCLISFALCLPLIRRLPLQPWNRCFFQTGLGALMLFLAGYNFSQREYIFVLFVLPYLFGRGLRQGGERSPLALSLVVGLLAAFGCSIKFYFVLPVLAVEAVFFYQNVFLFHTRRKIPPETLALFAALAALYAGYAWAFPAYYRDILPMALATYGGYDNAEVTGAFLLRAALIGAMLVVFTRFWKRADGYTAVFTGFAAAALGATISHGLQNKGWEYHAAPCIYFMALMLLMALARPGWFLSISILEKWRGGVILFLFAAQLVLLVAHYMPWSYGINNDDIRAEIEKAPGGFYIFTSEAIPTFPLAVEIGQHHPWAGRYPMLLPLPGILQIENAGGSTPYAQRLRREVTEDLVKNLPGTVIVPHNNCVWPLWYSFSMLDWFSKDADFRKLWKSYRADGSIRCADIYRLKK